MSKLEEEMAIHKMNRGEEYVLTLKQLKRKYPEGTETPSMLLDWMWKQHFQRHRHRILAKISCAIHFICSNSLELFEKDLFRKSQEKPTDETVSFKRLLKVFNSNSNYIL